MEATLSACAAPAGVEEPMYSAVMLISCWAVGSVAVSLLFGCFVESGRGAADRSDARHAQHRDAT